MKHNFVAQKQLRTVPGEPGPKVIESRKAYDTKTKKFSYYQQVTQYHYQKGNECTVGDWYKISQTAYDLEEGSEIHWDNYPS